MILKQKISDELFTCNIKINIFITAKIIKIKNEINNKIMDKLSIHNTKIANKFTIRLFEVNASFTMKLDMYVFEINNNFIVKIEKIKIYISSFSLKMNRFLALLNIITNKLNEAKKTLE